jgi:hypothetical protein
MTLLVPSVGDALCLSLIVNKTAQGNLNLHLYTNNYTPAKTDTISNYTESTAAGYSAKTLTGASWTVATVSGTTTASYASQTFTYTASENLYGYFLTDSTNTTVVYAEAFPSVFAIPSGGGSCSVALNLVAN